MIGKASKLVRLVQVLKVLRIFKIVRLVASLQSLLVTLKQANKELGLLSICLAISLLVFSSLTYFAEREVSNWSFVDSFWVCLMTITTVGYEF